MATRCLAELAQKLKDEHVGKLVPRLVAGVTAEESTVRAGSCTGLKDLLQHLSREKVQKYLPQV